MSTSPPVPTGAEAGMPGLEVASWYGFRRPRALPAPITAMLDGHLAGIMREPATVERLAALGLEPTYAGTEEFRRFIAADVARNAEPPRAANFQPGWRPRSFDT